MARVDLTSFAVTYTAIPSDPTTLQATGTQPRPSGIAIANNQLYVALQNLAGYTASGPGLVAVYPLGGADGGTSLSAPPQIISLGPGCLNAGGVLQVGDHAVRRLRTAVRPGFERELLPGGSGAGRGGPLQEPGRLPAADAELPGTGGSCESGGPTQIAYAGGTLFLADSLQGRLFTADPAWGRSSGRLETPSSSARAPPRARVTT